MNRSLFLVFFLVASSTAGHADPAVETAVSSKLPSDRVEFEFVWEQSGVDLELKMFLAPFKMRMRLGEQGPISDPASLPIEGLLDENRLRVRAGDETVIYLVAKNKGRKLTRFSVAPHATQPVTAALGAQFNCLCNGHVYQVKPGGLWYRVMSVRSFPEQAGSKIQFRHVIFAAKNLKGARK